MMGVTAWELREGSLKKLEFVLGSKLGRRKQPGQGEEEIFVKWKGTDWA